MSFFDDLVSGITKSSPFNFFSRSVPEVGTDILGLSNTQEQREAFETAQNLLGTQGTETSNAFNEAGDMLTAKSHIETLTESTIRANPRFFEKAEDVPTTAITMGMKGILSAKRLVLVATGAAKADAIRQLVCGGEVTTHNPSTFLKLHTDAWVVIDRALAEAAGYEG